MDKNAAIIIIGLGLLGLFLFLRKSPAPIEGYQAIEQPIRLRPLGVSSCAPCEQTSMISARTPQKQYFNEETWDIDWTKDGLPKRVTIHRNARETG